MRTPLAFSLSRFFPNLVVRGGSRGLRRCRPLSGIPCRSTGTARRVPIPTDRFALVHPKVTLRGEPASPGTWHARSCLRNEQPASQDAFRRVSSPRGPKTTRVKLEVSLRGVYSNSRALFASCPPPFRVNESMASTWLVRTYLRRPRMAPLGLRHRIVRPTSATHCFMLSKTSTRRPVRLPVSYETEVSNSPVDLSDHAEQIRFGRAAPVHSLMQRSLPHQAGLAEPSDAPSPPSVISHPGGRLSASLVKERLHLAPRDRNRASPPQDASIARSHKDLD